MPQTRSSSTIQRAESLDVNRRTCDTLGYAREELLSLSVRDLETVHLPGGVAALWRGLTPDEPVSTEGIHHPLERLKRGARTVLCVNLSLGSRRSAGSRRLLLEGDERHQRIAS